jgi:hypothetical protein
MLKVAQLLCVFRALNFLGTPGEADRIGVTWDIFNQHQRRWTVRVSGSYVFEKRNRLIPLFTRIPNELCSRTFATGVESEPITGLLSDVVNVSLT